MNKISTLFAFVCSLMITSQASAQLSQNFNNETLSTLEAKCWQVNSYAELAGTTEKYISLPLAGVGIASLRTPYLQFQASTTSVLISFNYQFDPKFKLSNTSWRKLHIYMNDQMIDEVTLESTSPTGTLLYSQSHALSGSSTPSIKFTISGSGNGSAGINLDNILISSVQSTICDPISLGALPIKLMKFQGAVHGNKAQLQWSVADNETGDFFQVLRSSDGKNFTENGTVFINNKVGAESYTFADSRELDAVTYYKLKIVNKDGSTSYSNIIALKSAATQSGNALTMLKNPVESTLNFSYSATVTTQSQLTIYNTAGVKVYSSRLSSQKGLNTVSLNLDHHLAAGTYILELVNGVERSVTRMVKN